METTTTINVCAGTWVVYNAAPQRSQAVAIEVATGRKMAIGGYKERLDMADLDDIESRIAAAMAWKEGMVYSPLSASRP